jgi:hypothetical protein
MSVFKAFQNTLIQGMWKKFNNYRNVLIMDNSDNIILTTVYLRFSIC